MGLAQVILVLLALGADASPRCSDPHEQDDHASQPTSQVRPVEELAHLLVRDGARESPTISRLINSIDDTDVFVYVHVRLPFGSVQGSEIRFLGQNGHWRYVAVWIDATLGMFDRVGMLGHELQHVVEVAEARDVHDQAGMTRLYETIGHRSLDDRHFETNAALQVQLQVLRELDGRKPVRRRRRTCRPGADNPPRPSLGP